MSWDPWCWTASLLRLFPRVSFHQRLRPDGLFQNINIAVLATTSSTLWPYVLDRSMLIRPTVPRSRFSAEHLIFSLKILEADFYSPQFLPPLWSTPRTFSDIKESFLVSVWGPRPRDVSWRVCFDMVTPVEPSSARRAFIVILGLILTSCWVFLASWAGTVAIQPRPRRVFAALNFFISWQYFARLKLAL